MSVDDDVLSLHDEGNVWSTNVYDLGETQASATCDDSEVLASVPQLPASTSVSTTGQTAASSSVLVQNLSPSLSPGFLDEPSPRLIRNTTPDATLDPTSTRHPSPTLDPICGSSPCHSHWLFLWPHYWPYHWPFFWPFLWPHHWLLARPHPRPHQWPFAHYCKGLYAYNTWYMPQKIVRFSLLMFEHCNIVLPSHQLLAKYD
ncbi:hypothetical protein MRX96_036736 [Rhipicephalus microplus]